MTERPVFLCSHIFQNTRPVLLVSKEDGDLQFLCGLDHDPSEIPHVVGLDHLLERDPSISQVLDLPENWEAERPDQRSQWVKRPIE